ncbi:OmpW family protein [Oleomonas cavernae]|uniref:OmpW family protein n=1 Tax=Oleomonas cavernae TaxID=2320859 RepID=A0A418W8T7_9PROT|nr:OmpW family outer membrane protein [Oleomonas cavernae]RJF86408.1 OmpW family protein [Oleomonas cavernae]
MIRRALLISSVVLAAVGITSSPWAADEGPWQVRVRGLGIFPDASATVDAIPGATVDIDATVTPEIDITYFITDNIALELVAATAQVGVDLKNPDLSLGHVWVLPPSLTVQYHFAPHEVIRPYLGAGANYVVFYSADQPAGPITKVEYDNAVGFVLQVGVDIPLADHWSANIDVKKIWLSTDATVNGAIKADVDIDPVLVGVGVGYRF